jgi:outer membrane receptor protein involved in Fe transport
LGRGDSVVFAAAALLLPGTAAAQNPATASESPAVHVIGTTPIPGLGTPVEEVPSQVQSLSAQGIARAPQPDLPSLLEQGFSGVSASNGQANAHQAEVLFHGFSASSLLGAPQGISVFLDGIRANGAFGDNVNWDLIQANAIATAHLISGSNPVYGLNTLGAALSINTKSGFSFPGQSVRLVGGAFGRTGVEVESGGHGKTADWFIAGNALDERGWRDHSPSAIRQFFAKTGWQDDRTDIDLSLALADNRLQGTQALPVSMLDNPRQPYTWPDRTDNDLSMVSLRASRFVTKDALLSGNLFGRSFTSESISSNVNDQFDALQAAGPGNSQGFNNRSRVRQQTWGASLQLGLEGSVRGRPNQLTVGGAFDRGSVRFTQEQQEAGFVDDRNTVGIGGFAPQTAANVSNTRYGVFFVDRWSFAESWTTSLSGRYDITTVIIRDASGTAPLLDGDHRFRRFNPAAGLAFNPGQASTWYANFSQSMRAPTPMELTCADPSAPCRLPNSFLADPPLKPVIAQTLEAGVRARRGAIAGASDRALAWNASLFRTVLRDDIQFIASGGATNAGFFRNVGETERRGFDLGASTSFGPIGLAGNYTRVDARFLSDFKAHSQNNSAADATGDIDVRRGNRIPGIPAYTLKLQAEWSLTPVWTLSATMNQVGRQFARGDENNADTGGALPSYRVFNLVSSHELGRGWDALFKVDNLFNRDTQSFGVLGQNFFTGPGQTFDAAAAAPEQFRTPGAPRAAWLYLRYAINGKAGR